MRRQVHSAVRRTLSGVVRRGRRAYAHGFRRRHRISSEDTMFRWDERAHYAAVGESARQCIAECLAAAGKRDVRRILDYGCGYGRVLRVVAREFPDAQITASDLDRGGVDYCRAAFGARGVYADPDPAKVSLGGRFDLIWVGSVFTHIERTAWLPLLRALGAALSADGVLVITTQGPAMASRLRAGELDYGLAPEVLAAVLESYAADGFGYGDYPPANRHDYPQNTRYGVTLVKADVVSGFAGQAGLRVRHRIPTGWDGHQDVYALVPASR